jgi:hypothetical protein
MNSAGLNLVQVGPETGRTRARARCGVYFAQGTLAVWNTYKEPPTVPLSRWHLQRAPSTSVSSLTWPLGHGALTACRCFGSDRAPGVAPQGAFWSRTVLPTIAQWFVLDAREAVDSCVQVRAALRCVTPYVLAWVLYVVGYKEVL